MPWCKPKDKEPLNQDDEYFIRNGGDKYIGWWDNKEKQFYMVGKDCIILYFEEHPNIEWWDEQVPDQDQLWNEALEQLGHELSWDHVNGNHIHPGALEVMKDRYTLIRK